MRNEEGTCQDQPYRTPEIHGTNVAPRTIFTVSVKWHSPPASAGTASRVSGGMRARRFCGIAWPDQAVDSSGRAPIQFLNPSEISNFHVDDSHKIDHLRMICPASVVADFWFRC